MIRHEITARIALEAGGVLERARIVYHTSAERWDGRPVIWICHALTANSDPEDWWSGMVGPGKGIDTDRYFVACVNMLGSPYGSEGPARENPATGKPWLLDFPRVTIRDMVQASAIVRKELGIDTIELIVGSSIGGFQAIEWAITEPSVFRKALFIATAPRISPGATAMNEAQRMAIEADPTFFAAEDLGGGAAGLKCARVQALISYRSYEGYALTQAEEDPDTLFACRAASYERYQGEKLVRRDFDAYSYRTLTFALDSHNTGRGRGGVAKALSLIQADVTVVAIESDNLFPARESAAWSALLPGADYIEIPSRFGHDGFLLENDRLTAIINGMLCKY